MESRRSPTFTKKHELTNNHYPGPLIFQIIVIKKLLLKKYNNLLPLSLWQTDVYAFEHSGISDFVNLHCSCILASIDCIVKLPR
jgi:hypothetical protein